MRLDDRFLYKLSLTEQEIIECRAPLDDRFLHGPPPEICEATDKTKKVFRNVLKKLNISIPKTPACITYAASEMKYFDAWLNKKCPQHGTLIDLNPLGKIQTITEFAPAHDAYEEFLKAGVPLLCPAFSLKFYSSKTFSVLVFQCPIEMPEYYDCTRKLVNIIITDNGVECLRFLFDGYSEFSEGIIQDRIKIWNRQEVLSWNDVILEKNMKDSIIKNIEGFLNGRSFYKKSRLPYKRGILFVGGPGNGKSLTTKIIATTYDFIIETIDLSRSADPDKIIEIIHNAYQYHKLKPKLIILEELDKLSSIDSVKIALLQAIDGINKKTFDDIGCGILTIATSNEPENLPKALICRTSRFDKIFEFNNPNLNQKVEYFNKLTREEHSISDIKQLFSNTDSFAMTTVLEVYIETHLILIDAQRTPSLKEYKKTIDQLTTQLNRGEKGYTPGSSRPIGFNLQK